MILPIYAALDRMDPSLIEAGKDLYGVALADLPPRHLPAHVPGRARRHACSCSCPRSGDFVSAQLLGGPDEYMVGNLIQQQFFAAENWPFGAALTDVMMLFLLVWMLLYLRSARARGARRERGGGPAPAAHGAARGTRASTGRASCASSPRVFFVFLLRPDRAGRAVLVQLDAGRSRTSTGFSLRWYEALLRVASRCATSLIASVRDRAGHDGRRHRPRHDARLRARARAHAAGAALAERADAGAAGHPGDRGRRVGAAAVHADRASQLSLTHDRCSRHITFSISYVTVVVRARLAVAEPRGGGGGAGPRRHPLARRSGWSPCPSCGRRSWPPALLVFALSFDDFVLSFFTTGESPQPLPVRIWSAIRFGVTPTINAIGTFMLAVSIARDRARAVAAAAPARPPRERASGVLLGEGGRDERRRGDPLRGRHQALRRRRRRCDDLDLEIEQGEFFSLLGPSGCGKTTTLRMVAGFEQPTEGRIYLEGEPVEDGAAVPAQREHGLPELRALRAPRRGRQRRLRAQAPQGRRAAEIRTRVGEALELGAAQGPRDAAARASSPAARSSASRSPGRWSTGPAVLLLDEPLGALDLKLRKQMQVELKEIQREVGHHVPLRHPRPGGGARDVRPHRGHGRRARCSSAASPEEVYERPPGRSWPASSGSRICCPAMVENGGVRLAGGRALPGRGARRLRRRARRCTCRCGPEKIWLDELEHGMVSLDGHDRRARVRGHHHAGDRGARARACGWWRSSRTPRAWRRDDRWSIGDRVQPRLAPGAFAGAALMP